MAKKIYAILILFLISLALPLTFDRTEACGWDFYEPDVSDLTLFTPELIHEPKSEWFFHTRHVLYETTYEPTPSEDDLTVAEWKSFLSGKMKEEEIRSVLFTDSLPLIRIKLEKEKDSRVKAFYEYLLLARTAGETFDFYYYDWWDERPEPDTTNLNPFLAQCKEKMRSCPHEFIKQRYAFQVLRLLITLNRSEEAEQWFTAEVEPRKNGNSIYYRSVQYMVRLNYRREQYAKSNYYTSIVYDQYMPRRRNAFIDFHVQEDKDWDATLAMAKNDRERAVLWQLFGMYYNPLEGIKQIYKLDPASDLLDLLLVTAVNELELDIHVIPNYGMYAEEYIEEPEEPLFVSPGVDVNNNGNSAGDDGRPVSKTNRINLVAEHLGIITVCAKNDKLRNQCLWLLASSYLNYLGGNMPEAETQLDKAESCAAGNDMKCQVNMFRAVYLTGRQQQIDAEFEAKLFELLPKLECNETKVRFGAVREYIMNELSAKYLKQGDLVKSELSRQRSEDDRWNMNDFYSDINQLEIMEHFMYRDDLSPFEIMLVQQYYVGSGEVSQALGAAKVYAEDFEGALAAFGQSLGPSFYDADPFSTHIYNFHHSRSDSLIARLVITASAFCKRMIELQTQTQKGSKQDRADAFFLIANGMYNITWYGNQSQFGYCFMDGYQSYNYPDIGNFMIKGIFDCSIAEGYYRKAMELSKDKEFQACCAWMIACCERNNTGFASHTRREQGEFDENSGFYLMQEKFKNTKYYKEVIAECGYFAYYVDPASVPETKE